MRLEKNTFVNKKVESVNLYSGEGCKGAYISSGNNCNYSNKSGGGCNTGGGNGGNC